MEALERETHDGVALGLPFRLVKVHQGLSCFLPPRDDIPFSINQVAGVTDLLTYPHGYVDGLVNLGGARDEA